MKNILTLFTRKEYKNTRVFTLQAFTLVETLVSITILTIAISGPLSVALFASSHAKDTKNKMIATWLAEENIEILRNKRDTVFIQCIHGAYRCIPENLVSGGGEKQNTREAAWKFFKFRNIYSDGSGLFSTDGNCYLGCAVDAYGVFFSLDYGYCDVLTTNTLFQKDMQNGIGGTHQIAKDGMYVCNRYANRTASVGGGDTDSDFARYLTVESLSPISNNAYDTTYKDTFRVRSYVNYKTPAGEVKTVMVEDFLNPRT